MKHRAKRHRWFRRCDCVRCTVAYWSDWTRAMHNIMDGSRILLVTAPMESAGTIEHFRNLMKRFGAAA